MMKRSLLAILFLALPLLAQNAVRVDCSANAQGDVRKPVVVEVTVTNSGKEPIQGLAVVRFNPKVSSADRKQGGMLDVQELRQPAMLGPGEKKTLNFSTPFESSSSFKGRKGSFRASNISPTGEITVEFSGRFDAAPAEPPR